MIEPSVLASLTAAVTVLANEYLKGVASEAGKSCWAEIKTLLGWKSDPPAAQIPDQVAAKLNESPEMAEKLVQLLKDHPTGTASAFVGRIEAAGGKVVVANTIVTDTFQM